MATAPHRPTPGFLIWRLAMRFRTAVDRAVEPLGLTHAQYAVLASLYGMSSGGHQPSQRELAEHTGMEPIYVSKLVRSLERAGLLDRAAHPTDARAVQLAVTAKGAEIIEQAIVLVARIQEQLTAPLGGVRGKETQALIAAIETLLAYPDLEQTGEQP